MTLILGLASESEQWESISRASGEIQASLVICHSTSEFNTFVLDFSPDVLLLDLRLPLPSLRSLLQTLDGRSTCLLVSSDPGELPVPVRELRYHPGVYGWIDPQGEPALIRREMSRAIERASLLRCAAPVLANGNEAGSARANFQQGNSRRWSDHTSWERAMRALSRILSAGFDVRGLFESFLDLSIDLVGAARAAILAVPESGSNFEVLAVRGLYGAVTRKLPLGLEVQMVEILMQEGRPIRVDDAALRASTDGAAAIRLFRALKAFVCIPIAAAGELCGVLALGNCLDGSVPSEEQIELLFLIGNHLGVAVSHSQLHHLITLQKAEAESVLAHMTNGVVVMDASGKITKLNRRASEIFSLAPESVIGRDHRILPAPLGDYLWGALAERDEMTTQIDVPGAGTTLDISTYPLRLPDTGMTVGSVLVVEDITQRRELEENRRRADQQELLNRVISQLAHEIKNPLVAVRTFADLFPSNSGDTEFNRFVSDTVLPEIDRLDQTVGKLVDFAHPAPERMQSCDLAQIVGRLLERAEREKRRVGVNTSLLTAGESPSVRADESALSRALWYLLEYALERSADGSELQVRVTTSPSFLPGGEATIKLTSNRPWIRADEIERLFDPLAIHPDGLNLELPVTRKILQGLRASVSAVLEMDGSVAFEVKVPSFVPSEAAASIQ